MKEYNEATIKAFAALFRGRPDAHGIVNECVFEPVTQGHYEKHLTGETNLGVYFVLDDGTCHFAAVDLDEKTFSKAKAIRNELIRISIPAYITESKSKGFHVYCFARESFKAVEIRRVLGYVLSTLKIKAEIFPKQDGHLPDDPDGTKHPGSYINLPAHGYSRPFITGDLKEVPLEVALERIQRVSQDAIDLVLKKLPGAKPLAPVKKDPEQSDNEMAVQKLLGNCAFISYCRDNAATLPEPYWWSMVHSLAFFGDHGRKKIHELSEPYPRYTKDETDRKVTEAVKLAGKEVGPHTCAFIEGDLGFNCPADCMAKKLQVKAPAGLASILTAQELRGPYLYRDKSGWHLNIEKLVGDLLTEYSFKTMRDNEECLIYERGIYIHGGETTIKEECEKRVSKKFMTTHNVNEVTGHIKRSTYVDRRHFNLDKWILNLENGLFNVLTGQLLSHTPDFLSTIRIPLDYDPQATYPRVQQFFTEVLRGEDIQVIEEIFGYCLIPDYTIQNAFLFLGDGANGKSTLLELLKNFIGADNCTNISLQSIENKRFAKANLFGKLANIYADIPSTRMDHVGVFKTLTGGDTVDGEKKFKDPFYFKNTARLIFSTNNPPKVDEDTMAFWRRWIFINFPHKFENSQADKQLLDKLIKKEELSGLLNVALVGLKRLFDKQGYSYDLTPDEIAEWHQKASDPIYAFVEATCDADPEGWISKDELYDVFLGYCDDQNIPRIGKESFGRALKDAKNVHVSFQRRGPRGQQETGWMGIQLKPDWIEDEPIDMEI